MRLTDRLAGCDLCLTGEGRIDEQTLGGKVVAGVARLAATHGVPAVAFVGAARLAPGQDLNALARMVGLERVVIVTPPATPLPAALAGTAGNLRRAARELTATFGQTV